VAVSDQIGLSWTKVPHGLRRCTILPLLQQLTEVIRLTVILHTGYPLSMRQVKDLLFERGNDICHETVRF
jgi:hypothetical protein